jgi:class 3 adenylate cyclase
VRLLINQASSESFSSIVPSDGLGLPLSLSNWLAVLPAAVSRDLMDPLSDPQTLAAELVKLRVEHDRVKGEMKTLEILYQNLIEHGEAVEDQLADRNTELAQEKKKSDDLLLNILPAATAEELKVSGTSVARSYDKVTVLFTDFKGFTQISEKLTPEQLVAELDRSFRVFDEIIGRYPIEKIKTIGDSYLCAGGLPTRNDTHPFDLVNAALEFQRYVNAIKREVNSSSRCGWASTPARWLRGLLARKNLPMTCGATQSTPPRGWNRVARWARLTSPGRPGS